jgi:uncharacterized protein (DUF1501 family)
MLTLFGNRRFRSCDGTNRRDFLKVGALGGTSIGLSSLLASRSRGAETGRPVKNTSVVWLWLEGGAPQIETFDPKMSAPSEFRSVTGEVSTALPGVTFGGTFPKIAKLADRIAVIRSFAHRNSGHGGGTHWVMTGYDNQQVDNGGKPTHPSMGSIAAKVRGPNHPQTGMPTYVRMGNILGDGPTFLGNAYAPFDPQGQARRNMTLGTKLDRFEDRRALLEGLDRFRRDADADGLMSGIDKFDEQAFHLITGKAPEAFDIAKEDQATVAKYGKDLGQRMLIARRLCEAGCGFVTISYGGWDMHANIKPDLLRRGPVVDHAVATFLEDVQERGLSERILLVITSEFGRTPRVNSTAGRDHWAPLSPLALAGGGLKMGQVIGESNAKAEQPKSVPISPQDLMATVFQVLGIERNIQFVNQAGRPVYLLDGGEPIRELV